MMSDGNPSNGTPKDATVIAEAFAKADKKAARQAAKQAARAAKREAQAAAQAASTEQLDAGAGDASVAGTPVPEAPPEGTPAAEVQPSRALVPPASAEPRALTYRRNVDEILDATPNVEDILADIDAARDEKDSLEREVSRAKVAFERLLRDIARVQSAAIAAGINLQKDRGEHVDRANAKIVQLRQKIIELGVYPNTVDSPEAERLRPALQLAVEIYRTRHGTPRVRDAIRFLERAAELKDGGKSIYQVLTKEAFEEHKKRDGHRRNDLDFRAIFHAGKVYYTPSPHRTFLLLHEQLKGIFAVVRGDADRELLLIAECLAEPLPTDIDLLALLNPSTPPPREPVELRVYLGRLQTKTEVLALERPHGTTMIPGVGLAVIEVTVDPADSSRKLLQVRMATGSLADRYLWKFRSEHAMSATIHPPSREKEDPKTPAWALILIHFLCSVGVKGLNTMRRQWLEKHSEQLKQTRKREKKSERRSVEPVVEVVNQLPEAEVVVDAAVVEPAAPTTASEEPMSD